MSALSILLLLMYWQAVFGVVGAVGNWFIDHPLLGKALDYNLIFLWFVTFPSLLENVA